jgi:alpha-amylase/alpha-mannosidase (GH57 family)
VANGKPGDHPLTDIFAYRQEVYGQETDELIRKIANLCSPRELDEWWQKEIGWSNDRALALRKARARYEELLERARKSGWESPNDT